MEVTKLSDQVRRKVRPATVTPSLEPDVVLLEKPFSEASMLRKIREVLDT